MSLHNKISNERRKYRQKNSIFQTSLINLNENGNVAKKINFLCFQIPMPSCTITTKKKITFLYYVVKSMIYFSFHPLFHFIISIFLKEILNTFFLLLVLDIPLLLCQTFCLHLFHFIFTKVRKTILKSKQFIV